jgi:hypothetical protein
MRSGSGNGPGGREVARAGEDTPASVPQCLRASVPRVHCLGRRRSLDARPLSQYVAADMLATTLQKQAGFLPHRMFSTRRRNSPACHCSHAPRLRASHLARVRRTSNSEVAHATLTSGVQLACHLLVAKSTRRLTTTQCFPHDRLSIRKMTLTHVRVRRILLAQPLATISPWEGKPE